MEVEAVVEEEALAVARWALVLSQAWADSDQAVQQTVAGPDAAHPATMPKTSLPSNNRSTNSSKPVVPLKRLSKWVGSRGTRLLGRVCTTMFHSLIWAAAWDEVAAVEGEEVTEAVKPQPLGLRLRLLRMHRPDRRMPESLVLIIEVEGAGVDIGAFILTLGMVERQKSK